MIKPDYFLGKYGVVFDAHDSAEERMRQMIEAFGVRESYEGSKPYIFISYAHMDSALVLPAIKAIQDKGFPVWFDAGITPGAEWAADISRHLKNASLVLAFVSENAFASNNCRAEIVYAFGHKKPMLTVRLDNTPLPDGLDMQLSLSQMFDAFAYDDGDEYVRRLAGAAILSQKIQPVLLEIYEQERRQAEESAAAERRREEMEAKQRAQAEEAERKRLAAEKAEREEADRKYQQAKEDARKRREAEEAQQKRWEAEKQTVKNQQSQGQKTREEANKRKQEETEKEKQINAEREKQKQNMEKQYRTVQASLNKKTMGYYHAAIKRFNGDLSNCAVKGLSLENELASYRDQISQTIYQDACQMEQHRHSRIEASIMLKTLPSGDRHYADALKRIAAIEAKTERGDWISCAVLVLLYFALNVCLALQVSYLQWPWYYAMLLLLAPAQAVHILMWVLRKGWYVKVENTFFVILLSNVLLLIADLFLFRFVGSFWLRIPCSLGVNLLSAASCFLWGRTCIMEWTLPKIK